MGRYIFHLKCLPRKQPGCKPKRREEVDNRLDRVERREQNLNKRQSSVDKRANEIEKLYEQQLDELQRISMMTIEEARTTLLENVEKEC